jgi:hypothetical protein
MLEGIPHRKQAAFFFAPRSLPLWHDSLRGSVQNFLYPSGNTPPVRNLVSGMTQCVWVDTETGARFRFIVNNLQDGPFRALVLGAGARR